MILNFRIEIPIHHSFHAIIEVMLEKFEPAHTVERCLNNFQNTISHVKFPEELEFLIRIELRVIDLPKNLGK